MGFFVNNKGEYYAGDRERSSDIEVTERPSPLHVWNGSEWIVDEVKQAESIRQDATDTLAQTDNGLARVTEDLITLLIARGVISLDELSEDARVKISARAELRAKLKLK